MALPNLHNTPSILLDDSLASSKAFSSLFFEGGEIITTTSLPEVPEALEKIDQAVTRGYYIAGWISYECAYALEAKLGTPPPLPASEPLIWMMVSKKPPHILSSTSTEQMLFNARRGNNHVAKLDGHSFENQARYSKNFDTIQNYILSGDVYQVNYTFPQEITLTGDPVALYERLRAAQPVEYGALINTGTHRILSFSPELFVRCDKGVLRSKPMKGTIKRGRYAEEDAGYAEQLKKDPKAQAENLMIVDLIRNDLSKIAEKGSVKTQSLFDIERYPTLWQMTSEITAKPKNNLKPSDIIKALFPCGSVTGAPKIRAMQIIREIESNARGVYCGTVGYFAPNGDFQLNVPIRTLAFENKAHSESKQQNHHAPSIPSTKLPYYKGRYHVGSGIVADSNKSAEYQECLLKGKFLNQTSSPFSLIETLLLEEGHYHLLERHINRLQTSADFFTFEFDEIKICDQLDEIKGLHAPHGSYRVRLLLSKAGEISLTTRKIDEASRLWSLKTLELPNANPQATVIFAKETVSSNDTFLFHKTTRRELYDEAYETTLKRGHADCLFLNENEEITEGAISNIFANIDDTWLTPNRQAGVLNGCLRADLIDKGEAVERTLTISDLKHAKSIVIGNSVRGLTPVRIEHSERL